MRRFAPILVGILVLGAFLWTLFFLYQKSASKPVVYETDTPQITDIVSKTVATGAIVPRREVEIKPRVSGVVEKLYLEPGEKVTDGASIAKIRVIPDMVRLNEAEARMQAATINLKNAEAERQRYEQLQGVVSETELQAQRLNYELRQQELLAAENHVALVKEGAAKSSGKVSNVVRSTVRGTVLQVPVRVGTSVIESNNFNAGTTIAVVADMSDMIFEGRVDESEVGKIQEGMGLDIKVGALDDHSLSGKLEYISPKGMDRDGAIQFEVRAAIAPSDGVFLRAGYSANANIVLDRRQQVLAISESLLQFEGEEVFVEVEVGPQTFEKRHLDLGLSDGIIVEVRAGLSAGDRIKKPTPEVASSNKR